MQTPRDARRGFTLVELLVVIAIIGILVGLLLPAVQNAREAGRRTQCTNNIRNLASAAQQHELQFKKLPNGGWGSRWIGDPDAGSAEKQNGGWIYNILPFIEQTALHDDGVGQTTKDPYNARRVSRTIALLLCPSRRPGAMFPINSGRQPFKTDPVTTVGRSDYAANAGVRYTNDDLIGDPLGCDIAEAEYPSEASYAPTNRNFTTFTAWPSQYRWTGVIYQKTGVSNGAIKDGTTYTYLFGEKYLDVDHYDTGAYAGDNDTMFSGFGNDNYRTTYVAPASGTTLDPGVAAATTYPTLRNDARSDVGGANCQCSFGGPHSGVVIFAFCDGQVRNISTSIDPFTHRFLGERADREILNDTDIGL